MKNNFRIMTYTCEVYPFILNRLYGDVHCFECSNKNKFAMRNKMIFNIEEPESENSELFLRLYYDYKEE